jgi:hypothetical protein
LPLEIHCEVNIPLGDNYDMKTFELKIEQWIVVEKVTQQYNDPRLAFISGFFYEINNVVEGVFLTLLLMLSTFKSYVSNEDNINKLGKFNIKYQVLT